MNQLYSYTFILVVCVIYFNCKHTQCYIMFICWSANDRNVHAAECKSHDRLAARRQGLELGC